jgi:hypothetical protein
MEIPAPPSDYTPLGGVVRLEGRSRTKRPRLAGGCKGAGPLAAGVLNAHFMQQVSRRNSNGRG